MYARIFLGGVLGNIFLSTLQSYFFTTTEQNQIVSNFMATAHPIGIAIFLFLIVVVVPVLEELIFRKLLWGIVRKVSLQRLTPVLVAVIFAAVHSYPASLFLIPVSGYLSYLRYKTKGIKAGIFFHVVFNATGMVLPYHMGAVMKTFLKNYAGFIIGLVFGASVATVVTYSIVYLRSSLRSSISKNAC